MSDDIQIELRELRDAIERVLDRVEAKFGPTIDLAADTYWTLDLSMAFDPYADPTTGISAAQLSDDVHEVRNSLGGPDEPVIWHDLTHIVGVLGRIAALDQP